MGREVRRVPANWEHPRRDDDSYKPLLGRSYSTEAEEFMERAKANGLQDAIDYYGRAPNRDDYMPDWPEAERTHYQMYEDTSEGTPISPVMDSPESLARWLADNNASAFGGQTASYEAWLRVANGGWAPSGAMIDGRGIISGVEAMADLQRDQD